MVVFLYLSIHLVLDAQVIRIKGQEPQDKSAGQEVRILLFSHPHQPTISDLESLLLYMILTYLFRTHGCFISMYDKIHYQIYIYFQGLNFLAFEAEQIIFFTYQTEVFGELRKLSENLETDKRHLLQTGCSPPSPVCMLKP